MRIDDAMPDQGVILLAEDNPDDIFVIRRALNAAGVQNPIQVVHDGAQAIAYLKGVGQYLNRAEFPLPRLLLLDLKMPMVDGFEVIKWVRAQPTLRALPILVLTSSDAIRDVNLAYGLGANSFLVKPLDFENTVALAKTINKFWFGVARAPEISQPEQRKKPGDYHVT
jgi:CheY-like chemotaxis protein